jgi:hypothetical protein
MPTQGGGKPAPRKKATGPTKAAALKKLGLTQEDLDTLKALSELKKVHSEVSLTEDARKIITATADVSSDPQAALEDRPAPPQNAVNVPTSTEEPVWYIRNLRGVEVSFRLSRQQKSDQKRTNLKPRGARGDTVRLEQGDLKDHELQTQVQFGLVEVIPEGEALEAIKKQYTNARNDVSPHIAMLRNELGQPYEQQPKFATDEEAYGIKVADLDPAVMQGKRSDKEIKRDGGFVQNAQHTPPGGNAGIINDGFMNPVQGDSAQLGNNDEHSQKVDALARSNAFEGPGAGLGEVTVKVEPVQRVR